MISDDNLNKIEKSNLKRKLHFSIDFIVFLILFIVSYLLGFSYNEDTSLFNDKLIDVCSIFFGVFIGCMYLFEKFKNNETHKEFLKFSKKILYLNLIIIAFSFIIILVNPILPDICKQSYILFSYVPTNLNFKPKVLMFSIYVALFAVTIYNIFRFIKIILTILKSKENDEK